jgi:replicative DNA helicase
MDNEANVIGTVMVDPTMLQEAHIIRPTDFYWEYHASIWRVILDLKAAGREPFEPTVRDEIESRGWQDRTAGRDENGDLLGNCGYLTYLVKIAYTPVFEQSILKMLELSRCRQGIGVCYNTAKSLEAGSISSVDVIHNSVKQLTGILESAAPADVAAGLSELAKSEAKRLGEYSQTANAPKPATTGWKWLDRSMEGGLQPGDFIGICARPNCGKSKVALFMLASACASGVRCGVISLDMSRRRLLPYIVPPFNNTRSDDFITGHQVYDPLADGALGEARLWEVCNNLDPEGNCLVVSDPRSTSLTAIAGYYRHLANRGCKVILLDQLQNIAGWERGARDRGAYQEILRKLQALGRRFDFANIVLHQISREGAERPELRHIKETGCVEEYADFVILLHDYQSSLISTNGSFILDGNRARVPKKEQEALALRKALTTRMISVHLAKTRSSSTERRDVMFDFVHGIAVRSE